MNNLNDIIRAAQEMVDNKMSAAAISLIEAHNLKLKIIDGRVVDDTDDCEIYLNKFITQDKDLLELKEDVRKLANESAEVLIIGPTGTGKELIAQALKGRRTGPFRAINCAGLPEQLVESELFGYEQGAFTGASSRRDGLMKSADDGVLFLDEISELPMQAQGKLLRAIQTNKVRKVGGRAEEKINCRFVAASNRSISEMCKNHLFRTDLYARLSTFELHTKSLEERLGDILLIYKALGADQKLLDYVGKLNVDNRVNKLELSFPFNVRTIQQHIKRYKILGKMPI